MQDSLEEREEKGLSGITMTKPDKPLKVVKVEAGEDDGKEVLHESRFSCRPVAAPPGKWFAKRVQKVRKDRPRNPNVTHLGATQQVG